MSDRRRRPTLDRLARWLTPLAAIVSMAAASPDQRLADAAKKQDAPAVRALLAAKADVNGRRGDGSTALHWAAHWDDRDTAALLLRAGAQANATTDLEVTPLSLACTNGSAAMVDLLLEAGANPNFSRSVGEPPLMTAARSGNPEVVKLLLAHGADIEGRDPIAGHTGLMWAVAEDHADVARLLVEKGAKVDARSKRGFTPLMFAAQQGNLELVKLLVAAGANVNETAPDGVGGDTNARLLFKPNTAAGVLMVAIDSTPESEAAFRLRNGHPDGTLDPARQRYQAVVQFLIEQGANVKEDGAGRTPLHSAVQHAVPEVAKMLLARGADPNARLTKPMPLISRSLSPQPLAGATPFWMAAKYGDVEMMRILVAAGADPRAATHDMTTPLMAAAGLAFGEGEDQYHRRWFKETTIELQQRAAEAVKLCLELGNDINAVNNQGEAAIHGAVYLGGTLITQLLAERGANLNVINKNGQTPWIIAQGEWYAAAYIVHKDTGDILAKLGADTSLGTLPPNMEARPK